MKNENIFSNFDICKNKFPERSPPSYPASSNTIFQHHQHDLICNLLTYGCTPYTHIHTRYSVKH